MNRYFKTSKKNRGNYIYYDANGPRTVLQPGANGVTEAIIEILHELDDKEVDNNRRQTRRQRSYSDLGRHLPDKNTNVFSVVEHKELMNALYKAIRKLPLHQKKLIYKIFYEEESITSIARKNNVTEGAIRNRLRKIYAILTKYMTKL